MLGKLERRIIPTQHQRRARRSSGVGLHLLPFAAAVLSTMPVMAAEAPPQTTPSIVQELGEQLVVLAVVVLIVESALAAIFNWRVYRMVFNNRAVKTIVMVVVGLLIVIGFEYDVFANVMALAVDGRPPSESTWVSWLSAFLSALIIAGGSEGVNTILTRLGIRNPIQSEPEKPKLNLGEAWISVKVNRVDAIGPVQIGVQEMPGAPAKPPLAGTVEERTTWQRVKMAFTAQAMRFPGYGGRTVTANKIYKIVATGTKEVTKEGATMREPFEKIVYEGAFAPLAIVDLTVDV